MSECKQKLCVFCNNFDLYTGSMDTFSESAGDMKCGKGYWDSGSTFPSGDDDSLRSVIFQAETCPDYDQVKA